jgi:hypothetical protein
LKCCVKLLCIYLLVDIVLHNKPNFGHHIELLNSSLCDTYLYNSHLQNLREHGLSNLSVMAYAESIN